MSVMRYFPPRQGYTIPLDKRLAADGRGLQDHTINDNFAKLAQALYTADREVSTCTVNVVKMTLAKTFLH